MPQKHKSSKSRSNQHSMYQNQGRYSANKKRKLARHLKNHPNDAQAAAATVSGTPKRGTPASRVWSSRTRQIAEMYAAVGINGLHALGNPKISAKVGDGEHLRYFLVPGKNSVMKSEAA